MNEEILKIFHEQDTKLRCEVARLKVELKDKEEENRLLRQKLYLEKIKVRANEVSSKTK